MSLDAFSHPEEGVRPSRPEGLDARSAPRIRPEAIRAYDIRGVAGRDIDRAGAYWLGLSYATQARAAGLSRIGVGRDGRISSPSLEQALVWGLMDGGVRVERIGLGPTPMLGWAVREMGLDGAIMVTASHNPSHENGFKILLGEKRVHGAALKELVDGTCRKAVAGSSRRFSVVEAYVEALARAAKDMAPLKVVWDCGNGATGEVVERLAEKLPGEHHLLNTKIDGRFPAHHPDPAVAENLSQLAEAVIARGADIGVAFDGDGDRIGVVDARGRILWADQLILLLARDLLGRRPGASVVADVKCSKVLFDGVEQAGGRCALSPSGYVLVREAMEREGALLGGELSGHIFFADGWGGVDDAVFAAIQTFLAVSKMPGGLAEFRDSLPPSFATPELRIPCPEARKPEVVAEVAERLAAQGAVFDPKLGLRVESDDGWWLLRASGTEPKITCRCEALHPDGLDRLRATLREQLRLSGLEADV
ncbi:phosphomannomutase/phosphoglucomutase [Phenylobacterium deserti]|uniref:Phosphomannomutase n=1 Tax=Phenylobacterium deserti TaxID=1914756 RepID=A0A328AIZ2_9CAUL|nr:phosphomannomutase/phosphoglucomutase [Phenylobacterium deserti]RAK52818.1 phosphomannomutase [Phenylobacterium deserti]